MTENGMLRFFLEGEKVGMVEFKNFVDPDSELYDGSIEFGDHTANRIEPITAEFLDVAAFDRVVVKFGGSGALDNIVVSPEPTTGLMLALGLAGLGTRSRRSQRRRH